MLTDAKGNKMYRRIQIRICFPDNVLPSKLLVQRAPAHKGFNSTGIDEMLNNVADQLETLYPWWDFTSVELTPEGKTARFVFKFASYRAAVPADAVMPEFVNINLPLPTDEESSAPTPEMEAGNVPPEANAPSGNPPEVPPSLSGETGMGETDEPSTV
jgi:hypothetical protein